MATILGITGAIGSGKSTFSEFLAAAEPHAAIYESREIITEVAEQFNKALASELHFEVADDDAEVINQAMIWLTELINEQLHVEVTWTQLALTKHRLAMHPEFYEKLFVHLKNLREQPALANARITKANKEQFRPLLQWLGGYLVAAVSKTIWFDEIFRRIDRYDMDKKLIIINGLRYPADAEMVRSNSGLIIGLERPGQDAELTDVTEASRNQIKPDCIVYNTGTLPQLKATAQQLVEDAMISALKPAYRTA